MPELLTKYPDLALKELKDAKLNCGKGIAPTILIHCPKENFCSLPTGELCIYGTKDISQMSQIQTVDIWMTPTGILSVSPILLFILMLGIAIGIMMK